MFSNNKASTNETSSKGTNELHGVSFISDDNMQILKEMEEGPRGVLSCQLPLKELNPGSFTLPYTTSSLNIYAMADLGTGANIMTRSMVNQLKLTNLKETNMLVERVDMTKKGPYGNSRERSGRPFLASIHARIDVFNKEILLGVGEDRIIFYMNGNVHHPFVLIEKANQIKPRPRDYSFKEWLKLKIGHTNVNKIVKNAVLNEWIIDSFDVESDSAQIHNDPYSMNFDEYKAVHERTTYSWHDEGFEEEERWESGLDEKYCDSPQVTSEQVKVQGDDPLLQQGDGTSRSPRLMINEVKVSADNNVRSILDNPDYAVVRPKMVISCKEAFQAGLVGCLTDDDDELIMIVDVA
ncbi:hypothetical protein Tco_0562328 [Tanacetum coccineum]